MITGIFAIICWVGLGIAIGMYIVSKIEKDIDKRIN